MGVIRAQIVSANDLHTCLKALGPRKRLNAASRHVRTRIEENINWPMIFSSKISGLPHKRNILNIYSDFNENTNFVE